MNCKYGQNFAGFLNAKYGFSFWKGRVALYAILKSLGVGPFDEVILPGYTCMVNANPIKYLGARPVYLDIEPDTFNINIELLAEKITANTKAIIAQHTYGYPCDMDAIMNIATKRDITVIEDCCLALGSKYKGKIAGTFGKAAYFSFQWNKPYTTGIGGMVITSDTKLAEKIKMLCDRELCQPSKKEMVLLAAELAVYRTFVYPRTTALAQTAFRYLTNKGVIVGSWTIGEPNAPVMADDFFKGITFIQACSGLRQLKKIEANIAHRKQMAHLYDRLLEEKGWPKRQYDRSIMDPVMVRYPIRIAEKNKALEKAARAGIELGSWFECPLHPIGTPLEAYDYEIGMCPEAEKASREVVNLPLHPRADEKTVERTVEFITRFTKLM
jgi:dTDP-4-amino-4,6-dideoxygalactose transaminase